MTHEAGIEAATFAVMLKMQLKDFGSQDDKGDFCCSYDQMELLETQSGLAAEEAIKAYLSASGMVLAKAGSPEMQNFAESRPVLVLEAGENSYCEALLERGGKFRYGYDEELINNVEHWIEMPTRANPFNPFKGKP